MQDSVFNIVTYETEFCPFCGRQMKLVGYKHTDKYSGETMRYWEKECTNPKCAGMRDCVCLAARKEIKCKNEV